MLSLLVGWAQMLRCPRGTLHVYLQLQLHFTANLIHLPVRSWHGSESMPSSS